MVAPTPARLRNPDSEQRRQDDSTPLREGVHADHATGSALDDPERSAFGAKRSTLVSSPISQTNLPESIELYHQTIRVKRPFKGITPDPPQRTGTELQGFSDKSKGRLRFTATNAGHYLISQFCLTYHNVWPIDGREFKRQVNLFLTRLRKRYQGARYLWVGEFQSRGCPHLHLYSSLAVTPENHEFLSKLVSIRSFQMQTS